MGPITDHAMPVAVHLLAETEDFIAVLDGHAQVSAPGERFAYNNGGLVVLALLAERPEALERVTRMIGASSWAADYVT